MPDSVERLILIAEDDLEAIASWKRDIREFNQSPTHQIHYLAEFASSERAAVRVLDRVRIHCAVVDLRLPEDDEPGAQNTEPRGNDVLARVLQEVGIPAVVYSGYIEEASELVTASQIHIARKTGGGGMEALRWLAERAGLMSAMDLMRRQVERESAKLFSQSIWPRWENAWNLIADPTSLGGVITRQVVAHVAEQLSLPPNHYHPEEFYFIPPLKADRIGTGDLLRIGDAVYVVVTPRCNLARDDYPNHFMLAHCKPMTGIWTGIRSRLNGTNDKSRADALKELQQYASQGAAISTHFLPPCGPYGPWLVQFKDIITKPSSEADALVSSRFASIASQFLPNLVHRCAAYLGRIGQPDLDCDVLRDQACR
jgi:hypothetical protein